MYDFIIPVSEAPKFHAACLSEFSAKSLAVELKCETFLTEKDNLEALRKMQSEALDRAFKTDNPTIIQTAVAEFFQHTK